VQAASCCRATDAPCRTPSVRPSAGKPPTGLIVPDNDRLRLPRRGRRILSTYALSHVPECGDVIAHGASPLSRGGRWVVLDLKTPNNAPSWLTQLGTALWRAPIE
jgi:hypothetical protein